MARIKICWRGKYRPWLHPLLAIATCLLVVTPVCAQEILQSTLTNMQESEQWWDKLWKDTFDPTDFTTSISIYTFSTAVRFLLAIGLIFWLFQYGQKMAESRGLPQSLSLSTQFFLPVLIVIIFLTNQGQYSRLLAYGLRDVINSWSDGVMGIQIAGYNVRTALADQLVTQDAKDVIAQQTRKCMQMPQPAVALPSLTRPASDPNHPLTIQQEQAYAYLECIQTLGTLAEQKKQSALTNTCSNIPGVRGACGFFNKFIDQTAASAKRVLDTESQKLTTGSIPNPFAITTGLLDFYSGVGASVT